MSRYLVLSVALFALAQSAGCGQSTSTQNSNTANSNTASTTTSKPPVASDSTTGETSPITSAHRAATAAPGGAAASSEKPDIETKALDAEIAKAEEKAKASGATDADKRAAASAYVKRGNVYYSAGQPKLYKFALGDFRRALRYQPDNAEAREKMDTIVSIYESMGRPVPTNGSEQ